MSIFWELHRWPESGGERDTAADVGRHVRKSERAVENLERSLGEKVDRLTLICRAMWELIRENTNLSEQDLVNKVREVDLLDGQLDGKTRVLPKKCSQCNMMMSPRHRRCIYCGTERLVETAFEAL